MRMGRARDPRAARLPRHGRWRHGDESGDVTCPWCAIGFTALERGIERLGGEVTIELHLQPSELNPGTPAEGEDIVRYMARRYDRTAEAVAERQAEIGGRGAGERGRRHAGGRIRGGDQARALTPLNRR